MPRILPTYTAPDASVLRGASQAWTQAGRRLGSIYNEVASADQAVARSQETIGRINATNIKDQLWPADIGRLLADQEKQSAKNSGGLRLRVDPRVDITGVAGTGFDPENYTSTRTHYQTSRGAGYLGRALSDGGYSIAGGSVDYSPGASGSPTTEYAGSNGTDYASAAGPDYSYNPSPAEIAQDKMNSARDTAVQNYTNQLVAQRDYWTQYYSGPGSQYQTDQTYNQAIAEGVQQSQTPPVPTVNASSDSGGLFSGLSDMFGGSGDQSGSTASGL